MASVRYVVENMQENLAINYKENPKKFWNYVNTRLKTSTHIRNVCRKTDTGEVQVITDD
jgi:hypothetical protein